MEIDKISTFFKQQKNEQNFRDQDTGSYNEPCCSSWSTTSSVISSENSSFSQFSQTEVSKSSSFANTNETMKPLGDQGIYQVQSTYFESFANQTASIENFSYVLSENESEFSLRTTQQFYRIAEPSKNIYHKTALGDVFPHMTCIDKPLLGPRGENDDYIMNTTSPLNPERNLLKNQKEEILNVITYLPDDKYTSNANLKTTNNSVKSFRPRWKTPERYANKRQSKIPILWSVHLRPKSNIDIERRLLSKKISSITFTRPSTLPKSRIPLYNPTPMISAKSSHQDRRSNCSKYSSSFSTRIPLAKNIAFGKMQKYSGTRERDLKSNLRKTSKLKRASFNDSELLNSEKRNGFSPRHVIPRTPPHELSNEEKKVQFFYRHIKNMTVILIFQGKRSLPGSSRIRERTFIKEKPCTILKKSIIGKVKPIIQKRISKMKNSSSFANFRGDVIMKQSNLSKVSKRSTHSQYLKQSKKIEKSVNFCEIENNHKSENKEVSPISSHDGIPLERKFSRCASFFTITGDEDEGEFVNSFNFISTQASKILADMTKSFGEANSAVIIVHDAASGVIQHQSIRIKSSQRIPSESLLLTEHNPQPILRKHRSKIPKKVGKKRSKSLDTRMIIVYENLNRAVSVSDHALNNVIDDPSFIQYLERLKK